MQQTLNSTPMETREIFRWGIKNLMGCIVALGVLFITGVAWGYTVSQATYETDYSSATIGQSFTTIGDGAITQIQVQVATLNDSSATLHIYTGVQGMELYTQNVTLGSGANTIVLASPVYVETDAQYSFTLTTVTANSYQAASDVYSSGTLISSSGADSAYDLVFEIIIDESYEPDMDVQGNGVSIANGDDTPSTVDGTDFGEAEVPIGPATQGTVTHTFTIANTGNIDLRLTGSPLVEIAGTDASDFIVVLVPFTPVAAGGSTNFQIEFAPSGLGTRTAQVVIESEDPDEDPYVFTIQGTGVDTTPPDKPAVPDLAPKSDAGESDSDNITNDATPTFQGGAGAVEAGSTVTVYSSIDGVLGTTSAATDGSWSFTPSSAVSDGTHQITVTATDASGNTSEESDPLTVLIDTQAPPPPDGRFPSDGTYTNDNTPTFTWNAVTDPGGSGVRDYHIEVFDSGGTEVKDSYPGDTDYTPAIPLADDAYTWKLATRDVAGNTGDWSSELGFVVDTVSPTVTAVVPSVATVADANAGTKAFTITVNYSEPMNTGILPMISFPNEDPSSTLAFASGSWTDSDTYVAYYGVTDAGVEIPDIDVRVTGAQDLAGNTQVQDDEADLFSIDTKNPTITAIVSTTADGYYKAGEDINVTVDFSEPVTLSGGTLDVALDSGASVGVSAFGPADSAATTYTVGVGENSCDLDATEVNLSSGATLQDQAGNDAVINLPATTIADGSDIAVDTTLPEISGISVSDETVDANCEATVTFSATVTDNCCILPSNVSVTVILPTDNAVLDNIVVNRVQNGRDQVDITGSADVRCLTSCPARVEVHIEAHDCCGNDATPVTSSQDEGRVYDVTPPQPADDPNGSEDRSGSDGLDVRMDRYGQYRLMVREDTPVRIDVVANDADNCSSCTCCGVMWIHDIVDPPEYGTVKIESDHGDCHGGSVIRYAPYRGYVGPDRFTYRIVDACGNVSTAATVYLEVVPKTETEDVYTTTCSGAPIEFTVRANDLWINPDNPDKVPFTFSITAPPKHGVVLGDLSALTYVPQGRTTEEIESAEVRLRYIPADGFTGRDVLRIKFSDPFGSSSTAAVDVLVEGCQGTGQSAISLQQGSAIPIALPETFDVAYAETGSAGEVISEGGVSYSGAILVERGDMPSGYRLILETKDLPPGSYRVVIPIDAGEKVVFAVEVVR